ncbi:hypothetical protein Tsubulata_007217, partial [Turnera subulata]
LGTLGPDLTSLHGPDLTSLHRPASACLTRFPGDIGPRNLYSGEHFEFEVEASTLCRFWWGEPGEYSYWFEIYKPSRDKFPSFGNRFKWIIKLEGPCFLKYVKYEQLEICYPWT